MSFKPINQPLLADRWFAAASEDPDTDRAILQLIENNRSGGSINEARLLSAIEQHANGIAAQSDRDATSGTPGQGAGGNAA